MGQSSKASRTRMKFENIQVQVLYQFSRIQVAREEEMKRKIEVWRNRSTIHSSSTRKYKDWLGVYIDKHVLQLTE